MMHSQDANSSVTYCHYCFNRLSISAANSLGAVCGLVRLIGVPSREIKNLVKFHLISFHKKPVLALVRQYYKTYKVFRK